MKKLVQLFGLLAFLSCAVLHADAATITLTQSASSSTAGVSSANLAFGPSPNVATGDLIIVCDNWGNSAGTHAVTDSASNTYHTFPQVKTGIAGLNDLYCAWAIHAGSPAALTETVTVTGGGSHTLRIAIYDYNSSTGWLASPTDQSNASSTTSSSSTTGSVNIAPTVSGTLVFSAMMIQSTVTSGSFTVSGTGYSEQPAGGGSGRGWGASGAGDTRADGCHNLNAGTGATGCSFSWSPASGGGFSFIEANFVPAAGAGAARRRVYMYP